MIEQKIEPSLEQAEKETSLDKKLEKISAIYDKDKKIAAFVAPLNKELATIYASELADIHNLIPHVSWTQNEIIADEIDGRRFPYRWDLSQILLSPEADKTPIGFSIAYFRSASTDFVPFNSVYLHRGAIKTAYQRKGIGIAMVGFALSNAFDFISKHPDLFLGDSDYGVTMQTNDEPSNREKIKLYRGLGGIPIGQKKYQDKTDIILGFSRPSFINSELFKRLTDLIKL